MPVKNKKCANSKPAHKKHIAPNCRQTKSFTRIKARKRRAYAFLSEKQKMRVHIIRLNYLILFGTFILSHKMEFVKAFENILLRKIIIGEIFSNLGFSRLLRNCELFKPTLKPSPAGEGGLPCTAPADIQFAFVESKLSRQDG